MELRISDAELEADKHSQEEVVARVDELDHNTKDSEIRVVCDDIRNPEQVITGLTESNLKLSGQPLPQTRQVEVEIITKIKPIRALLLAEHLPTWLLSLDNQNVETVTLGGVDSLDDLERKAETNDWDMTLYRQAFSHLGKRRIQFNREPDPSTFDLVLVSGSPTYLSTFSHKVAGAPALFLQDTFTKLRVRRQRLIDESAKKCAINMSWTILRHSTFGGPTSARALFGKMNIDMTPVTTTLRRSISHFLDYSIQPHSSSSKDIPTCYSGDDLLNMDQVQKPVRYQTHFSCTGWGKRPLSFDELGVALGLSLRLRGTQLPPTALPHIPIQIMDGVLQGAFNAIRKQVPTDKVTLGKQSAPKAKHQTRTWLPALGEFLSHDWINPDLVTDKAAKSDDAEVPTSLWDQRITLIYPGAEPHLPLLRCWLLSRLRLRVTRSFLSICALLMAIVGWQPQQNSARSERRAASGNDWGDRVII
jgi:hypothetical protein